MADAIDEPALHPQQVNTSPSAGYASAWRKWQGIPTIERSPGGRLWAGWYSGGDGEGPENYVLLMTSDDDGETWGEPMLVVDPEPNVRAFDPCLWHDPDGRLWFFWAQSWAHFDGRCGVWAVTCDDSGAARRAWSTPRWLCNGIMMNKPTVLSTGEWLLPAAVWAREWTDRMVQEGWIMAPKEERKSNVICSIDHGATWERIGGADVPQRTPDEHMIVERRDGALWMLVRTSYGIGESVSCDRGRTWTPGVPTQIGGPDSRFFIRRLAGGALLLVNHHNFTGRSHLTALVSDDDGRSWQGGLLLDEREGVSYPDGVQAEDGRIYVIYDHDRHGAREILMAVFTEDDARCGRPVSGIARLKARIDGRPG